MVYISKGVGRKFSGGGGHRKRPKNSKDRKIALLSLFQGEGVTQEETEK